jgi:hypothetical protein
LYPSSQYLLSAYNCSAVPPCKDFNSLEDLHIVIFLAITFIISGGFTKGTGYIPVKVESIMTHASFI